MENNPQIYPNADAVAVARKVLPLRDHPEMQDPSGIDPDRLKELSDAGGINLVDHEIITLLRRFPVDELVGIPRVAGRKVFQVL
mmetsp:Transcript_13785/g.31270  ORF Transcript_13785/g.31270 Transcript_13785/m.31270 type:complete len:84 (+) Transcript_13785:327-578(+)